MKTLLALAAVVVITPIATARVWTTVYGCDEVTPLAPVDPNHPTVYRDIMVGTHLTIVVSSDTAEHWAGRLLLSWDDVNEATLSGREYDPELPNYKGSCLPAAGSRPGAWDYLGPEAVGLEFLSDLFNAAPGDWFVFDYRAEQVGSVDVVLCDLFSGFDAPIETLSFTHVASRDFNRDGTINFKDLVLLGGYWGLIDASSPNSAPPTFDLSADGRIDTGDLALFSEYWLERMDCSEPLPDPNESSPGT
jgi:hypothetical protein